MQMQQTLLLLGVGTLYIGYAGVMGVLIRRATASPSRLLDGILAFSHGLLLFLPASILVIRLGALSLVVRWILLIGGLIIVAMAAKQPQWTPQKLWRRSFGQRYFAASMALAAFWALCMAAAKPNLAPALLGVAAVIACGLSLRWTPPDVTSPLR
jgi:hypothetical protein